MAIDRELYYLPCKYQVTRKDKKFVAIGSSVLYKLVKLWDDFKSPVKPEPNFDGPLQRAEIKEFCTLTIVENEVECNDLMYHKWNNS